MLKRTLSQMWADDQGAIIAIEFLFFVTIVLIGLVVGFTGLRDAVVTELTELGNAILALSQGYTFSGLVGCCSAVDGSQAIDTPGLLPEPLCVPPFAPSPIDVIPCN